VSHTAGFVKDHGGHLVN